jgi:ribosome maturation factor RimP
MPKKKKKNSFRGKQGAVTRLTEPVRMKLMSCAVTIAEEICLAENYELVQTEFRYDGVSDILCIYLDKDGGIQMKDCTAFSRQLSDSLDVRFNYDVKYRLEISSPGIERPVVKESDYERFKGKKVVVKTREAIEGQKTFTGTIIGYSDGNAEILVDEIKIPIPFSIIKNAHLLADIGDK